MGQANQAHPEEASMTPNKRSVHSRAGVEDMSSCEVAPMVAVPQHVFGQSLSPKDRPRVHAAWLQIQVFWGESLLATSHKDPKSSRKQEIRIGSDKRCDFRVLLGDAQQDFTRAKGSLFPLIRLDENGCRIFWQPSMAAASQHYNPAEGEHAFAAQSDTSLASPKNLPAAASPKGEGHVLDLHERVAVQVGSLTFVMQYVAPEPKAALPWWRALMLHVERRMAWLVALSLLAHILGVFWLQSTPIPPTSLDLAWWEKPDRFAQLILKPKPVKKAPVRVKAKPKPKPKAPQKVEPKPKAKPKPPVKKPTANKKADAARRAAQQAKARSTGLLQALRGGSKGRKLQVLASRGAGTKLDSQWVASSTRTKVLKGALRERLGNGGAGPAQATGVGAGLGASARNASNGSRLRARDGVVGKLAVATPTAQGCLSQEVVLQTILSARTPAKYCYEKALQKDPNLAGKVTTHFIIGPSGKVDTAEVLESTMGNPTVGACLVRLVRRLRFPPCSGGGVAEVTYPWIFKSGGGG